MGSFLTAAGSRRRLPAGQGDLDGDEKVGPFWRSGKPPTLATSSNFALNRKVPGADTFERSSHAKRPRSSRGLFHFT